MSDEIELNAGEYCISFRLEVPARYGDGGILLKTGDTPKDDLSRIIAPVFGYPKSLSRTEEQFTTELKESIYYKITSLLACSAIKWSNEAKWFFYFGEVSSRMTGALTGIYGESVRRFPLSSQPPPLTNSVLIALRLAARDVVLGSPYLDISGEDGPRFFLVSDISAGFGAVLQETYEAIAHEKMLAGALWDSIKNQSLSREGILEICRDCIVYACPDDYHYQEKSLFTRKGNPQELVHLLEQNATSLGFKVLDHLPLRVERLHFRASLEKSS